MKAFDFRTKLLMAPKDRPTVIGWQIKSFGELFAKLFDLVYLRNSCVFTSKLWLCGWTNWLSIKLCNLERFAWTVELMADIYNLDKRSKYFAHSFLYSNLNEFRMNTKLLYTEFQSIILLILFVITSSAEIAHLFFFIEEQTVYFYNCEAKHFIYSSQYNPPPNRAICSKNMQVL